MKSAATGEDLEVYLSMADNYNSGKQLERQLAIARHNEQTTHEANVRMAKELATLTQQRDAAVNIIEQTLCGISFGELRKAYAAYRAGEKYETVVDRVEAEIERLKVENAQLRGNRG